MKVVHSLQTRIGIISSSKHQTPKIRNHSTTGSNLSTNRESCKLEVKVETQVLLSTQCARSLRNYNVFEAYQMMFNQSRDRHQGNVHLPCVILYI